MMPSGVHGSGAGHVDLHVLHAVRRLQRQAARVERDALADQAQVVALAAAAVVAEDDELGRLVGAVGH